MELAKFGIEDCADLLHILQECEHDQETIMAFATRIGVQKNVRVGQNAAAIVRWQAVLEAALANDKYDGFLKEVVKSVPARFHQSVLDAAPGGRHDALRGSSGGPELGGPMGGPARLGGPTGGQERLETACLALARTRTRNEMNVAAIALRQEVLLLLEALAPGGNRRPLPIAAVTTGDAENVAERLAILGMNVLTVVDRLLEITESANTSDGSVAGSELFLPETIDGLMAEGTAIGAPNKEQTMHLARNARSATWLHTWRFMSALRNMSAGEAAG